MNIQISQVKLFYETIWNQHDKSIIADVLQKKISFRGSLGDIKQGHEGFIEYLDMIHHALDDYHCKILDMVSEPSRVFARIRFSGVHRDVLMGHKATGRKVSWEAAALFDFIGDKVDRLWVLGDLLALEQQLKT